MTRVRIFAAVVSVCMIAAVPAHAATTTQPSLTLPTPGQAVGKTLNLAATAGPDAARVEYYLSGVVGPVAVGLPPDFAASVPDLTQAPVLAGATASYAVYAVAFSSSNSPSLTSTTRTIFVDTTTQVALDGPFGTPQRATDITAQASNVPPDVTCVQWRVDSADGSSWSACQAPDATAAVGFTAGVPSFSLESTGATLRLLAPPEGSHQVGVRVTDKLGNQASASKALLIDRTPPQLAITSGPAEGSTVDTSSVTFGFTADPSAAVVLCAFDQPVPSYQCAGKASDFSVGMTNGPHSFVIRAVDAAGNFAQLDRSFNVVLGDNSDDTTTPAGFVPPSFTITGSPSSSRKRVSARILLRTNRGTTRVTIRPWLTVTKTRNASRITVRCRAPRGARRACPFAKKMFTLKASSRAKLARAFRNRTLPSGTTITVLVTGPGAVGRAVVYRVRSGRRSPKRTGYCTKPGSQVLRKKC